MSSEWAERFRESIELAYSAFPLVWESTSWYWEGVRKLQFTTSFWIPGPPKPGKGTNGKVSYSYAPYSQGLPNSTRYYMENGRGAYPKVVQINREPTISSTAVVLIKNLHFLGKGTLRFLFS